MEPQETPVVETTSPGTEAILETMLMRDDENTREITDILEKMLVQADREDEQTPVLEHQLVVMGEVKAVLNELLSEYKKPCTVNLILE